MKKETKDEIIKEVLKEVKIHSVDELYDASDLANISGEKNNWLWEKELEEALTLLYDKMKEENRKERHYKTNYWELYYPDGTSSLTNYNPIEKMQEDFGTKEKSQELVPKQEISSDIKKVIEEIDKKTREIQSAIKGGKCFIYANYPTSKKKIRVTLKALEFCERELIEIKQLLTDVQEKWK